MIYSNHQQKLLLASFRAIRTAIDTTTAESEIPLLDTMAMPSAVKHVVSVAQPRDSSQNDTRLIKTTDRNSDTATNSMLGLGEKTNSFFSELPYEVSQRSQTEGTGDKLPQSTENRVTVRVTESATYRATAAEYFNNLSYEKVVGGTSKSKPHSDDTRVATEFFAECNFDAEIQPDATLEHAEKVTLQQITSPRKTVQEAFGSYPFDASAIVSEVPATLSLPNANSTKSANDFFSSIPFEKAILVVANKQENDSSDLTCSEFFSSLDYEFVNSEHIERQKVPTSDPLPWAPLTGRKDTNDRARLSAGSFFSQLGWDSQSTDAIDAQSFAELATNSALASARL